MRGISLSWTALKSFGNMMFLLKAHDRKDGNRRNAVHPTTVKDICVKNQPYT